MTILSNSLWAVRFIFSITKLHSFLYFFTTLYRSLSPIVISYISAVIIDGLLVEGISTEDKTSVALNNVFVLFVVLAFGNIFSQINQYSRSHISRHLRLRGYEKIHEKASELSLSQLEDPEVNNLMKRANDNIRSTIDLFRSITYTVTETISFIADALIILAFLPIYIVGYAFFSIVYFFPIRYFIKKDFNYNKEWTEGYRKAMQTTGQLTDPTFIKEIRVNESYSFFDGFFKKLRDQYLSGVDNIRRKWSFTEYFVGVPLLVVHFFGYFDNVSTFILGSITLGTMSFRFSSLARFNSGLSSLMQEFSYVTELSMGINECRLFLSMKPSVDGSVTLEKLATLSSPSIDIKNLNFKYKNSEKNIIKNLNLSIKPGEKIAIVGHNGAGKTTLIKLISKIYDVEDGEILIDGKNLNALDSVSYYKNLGVLYQDFMNYGQLSIRENITQDFSKDIDESKVVNAAKLADAHEFILDLPKGYDTLPIERYTDGVRLSGGQKQKLALARFFYKDAPLLIFDEPTSAIDAVSEFKIFNNIYDFFKNKTVIIISHRFSTVRNADRIIVMEHGRIAEEGTHQELMQKNGIYADSYNLQAGEYK